MSKEKKKKKWKREEDVCRESFYIFWFPLPIYNEWGSVYVLYTKKGWARSKKGRGY
jgi:hypothetical protein